jgi:hypothetical protein
MLPRAGLNEALTRRGGAKRDGLRAELERTTRIRPRSSANAETATPLASRTRPRGRDPRENRPALRCSSRSHHRRRTRTWRAPTRRPPGTRCTRRAGSSGRVGSPPRTAPCGRRTGPCSRAPRAPRARGRRPTPAPACCGRRSWPRSRRRMHRQPRARSLALRRPRTAVTNRRGTPGHHHHRLSHPVADRVLA